MNDTIIDKLYHDNLSLVSYLDQYGEISLRSFIDNNFKKTLLLSAFSFFESEITRLIIEFVLQETKNSKLIIAFIKAKAVERQFHTYFDWDANNANRFFALFGSEFRDMHKADVKNNSELELGVTSFMELGRIRNQLVHLNFASFPIEKTADEIYDLYKKANKFIEHIREKLK
jgi:hypothetical protein